MFPPLFTPGPSVFSSKQACLPLCLGDSGREVTQNLSKQKWYRRNPSILLSTSLCSSDGDRPDGADLGQGPTPMRFITSLEHHVFTELLWGHFRPISCWMSERKICWVEWLKVWDNGTVNNQEMGSKRILKRSRSRPAPAAATNLRHILRLVQRRELGWEKIKCWFL